MLISPFLSSMAWRGWHHQAFISANIDGIISETNNFTSSHIRSRWRRLKGRQAHMLTKTIPGYELGRQAHPGKRHPPLHEGRASNIQ